jgi:hypothetical protein
LAAPAAFRIPAFVDLARTFLAIRLNPTVSDLKPHQVDEQRVSRRWGARALSAAELTLEAAKALSGALTRVIAADR